MPEAKIGFFCDVGVSHFLSRLQNGMGYYIALTSQFIKGIDLVKSQLADFFVKSENIPKLLKHLEEKMNPKSDLKSIKSEIQ